MAVTEQKQGFLGIGTGASNPGIALGDVGTGTSAVIGLDGADSGKFKVLVSTNNPTTVTGGQFSIDGSADGNINLTPNGTGAVNVTNINIISGTSTFGDVVIGTGSISTSAVNGALAITTGTGTLNIGTDSTQKGINIGSGTGNSEVIIDCGTNGIDIGTTGNSHPTMIGSTTGTSTTTIQGGTGGVNITGNNGQIDIQSGGQNVTIGTGGAILNVCTGNGVETVNLGTGAGAKTTFLGSTNTTSTTTVQSGTGGIALNSAGALSAQPATNSTSTATSTVNSRLSVSTFTGFTTAGGGSQAFTISNTTISATSGISVTVTNLNASTNGALMQIQGITQAASSIVVSTKNVAGSALGAGDNVLITVWVMS